MISLLDYDCGTYQVSLLMKYEYFFFYSVIVCWNKRKRSPFPWLLLALTNWDCISVCSLQCWQTINLLPCHTRKAIKYNPCSRLWIEGFSNAFWSDETHREQLSPDPRPLTPSRCAIDQYVVIKPPLNECLPHSKDYQLSGLSLFLFLWPSTSKIGFCYLSFCTWEWYSHWAALQ